MTSDSTVLHYDVHERLGVGGMGVVYRATDTRLGRAVALKFLSESLSNRPDAVERLTHEARAAAQLDHPNIGTIHAIESTADGRTFISMALYEGESLEALLNREARLPFDRAVRIAIQILKGLAHAHEAGVVHRDIKPANIFLLPDGLVKILDFGIAKAAGMLNMNSSAGMVGTVEYVSPQQARGEEVNQQADLWAVGVLLYEMLAGVTPFANPEGPFAVIYSIASRTPERLSELHPELPPGIDTVMERALHKTPDGRYLSADEMLADLRALLAGSPGEGGSLAQYLDALTESDGTLGGRIPSNLPARERAIVGREDELRLIGLYLEDPASRMVTLVGPGGMGKTSLSLQAAKRQLEARKFLHGVFFVPLETTTSPELIPSAVAEALDLTLQGPKPAGRQVIAHISNKQMLLVLDNLEHLIEGASFVAELLEGCPNLKIIATSRERLNLSEEWIIALQGLSLPDKPPASVEEALTYGAPLLFSRHAERVQPSFRLEPANLADVLDVCRLVRGHPLGIELAAVWVRSLPVKKIATEIKKSYDFLASKARDANKRHLSIRAVFEHSWELLSEEEREAVRRLAVFRGSFTPDAAQHVAGTPLPVLAGLVDKSILQQPTPERFEQHPLIRQYSREKLNADRQAAASMRERHAAYYTRLLVKLAPIIRTGKQRQALQGIETELDNIRDAWAAIARRPDLAALEGVMEPLRVFYDQSGRAREGAQLLALARATLDLRDPEHQVPLARLMVHQGWLMLRTGEIAAAASLVQQAVKLLQPRGDTHGLYWAAIALGAAAAFKGNFPRSKQNFLTSLELARKLDEPSLICISLDNLGSVEQALGDSTKALEHYQAALELARQDDNTPQVVSLLNNLGSLQLSLGQPAAARPLLEEGFELAKRVRVQRLIPYFLANLGQVNFELERHKEAARAYREAILAARRANHRWLECALLPDLARVALAAKHPSQAQAHLRHSLQTALELKDPPLILHATAVLAELFAADGRQAEGMGLAKLVTSHPAARWDDKNLAAGLLPDAKPSGEAADEPEGWLEKVKGAFETL